MSTKVVLKAADVTAWRGSRTSGDMMFNEGALVLSTASVVVELEGSRADLEALGARIAEQMAAEAAPW